MLCLGIESSCDETGVALVDVSHSSITVKAELVASQVLLHEQYGGVVPELASREHLLHLPRLLPKLLEAANLSLSEVDLVAVTAGPGLKGCLLVGVEYAKAVALSASKPIIGVNHIEGHIFSAHLSNSGIGYPFLALVVSGGHTEIILVKDLGKYEVVERTKDDAVGEAFDKAANILGFGYPGGAELAKLADEFVGTSRGKFKLPLAMRDQPGFSFSGVKTAIAQLVSDCKIQLSANDESSRVLRGQLCDAIQEVLIANLMFKLRAAMRAHGISTLVVCGGVSANERLKGQVEALPGARAYFPSAKHRTDNAAMIAAVGGLRALGGETSELTFGASSVWRVESLTRPELSEK